ncbi:secretion protein [Duganella rhizosphaerae]|uniref:HlyD family secretion protein n=1 Tax=Duganella rhizosphaerae TaxID=2885763 RepID=UPI0030EAA736
MTPDSALFRQEVMDTDRERAYGDIVLVHPIENYLIFAFVIGLFLTFSAFAWFGHYTRHESIQGVIEPSHGVIKLYASQVGVLKMSAVEEGQLVKKGQVLMVFETQHQSVNGHVIESELDAKLLERLTTLHQELGGTMRLHEAEHANAQQNLQSLLSNHEMLLAEVQTQGRRVQSAERTLTRFEQLHKEGFMSDLQTQQKMDDLLEQRMRLQDLQKSVVGAESEIARMRNELVTNPIRKQVSRAQLARNISQTESELSKQKNEHEWSVVAPCDGVVSAITIAANQTATVGVPLASILPSKGELQASLYAPSHALGFIHPGQIVKMKLDAFPYQKFGVVEGRILSVANTPIRTIESSPSTKLATSSESTEPMYAIRVTLNRQFILAYQTEQQLRPGLQLGAEIQLDTRHLYEWALEPLYTLKNI